MKESQKPSKSYPYYAINYVNKKVPIIQPSCTIGDAEKLLKNNINDFVSLDYIYVVDKGRLIGVFSIRKIYSHKPGLKIKNICKNQKIIKVGPKDGAILAAYLSMKNKISSIPVVNEDGSFLGIITKEDILSILHKKHIEDKFMHAGIHRKHTEFEDTINTPVLKTIKFRMFWLFVGLIGGLVAAGIVESFEQTLSQNIVLAAFIPLIVYISDAVGTQLEAFSIRDFALHRNIKFSKYFLKQMFVVFIISLFLGIISLLICTVFFGGIRIALVIAISIICATISSIFSGLLIPFSFRKMKKDPAIGSGPIGTIIQDILSVTIFFIIAALLL